MNPRNFFYVLMALIWISFLIYNSFTGYTEIRSLISELFYSYSSPFLSIIAIVISVTSILISWYVHKHRIDYEISTEHFDQIRNNVIKPLLTLLKTKPHDLPSIEEIKNKSNIYGILNFDYSINFSDDMTTNHYNIGENIDLDCDLTIDFLENHYIKLIPLWNNTIILNKNKFEKLTTLKISIQNKIKYQLDIIFFDKEKNKKEFQLNKYIDHFIELLENNSYKESLFKIHDSGNNSYDLTFNSRGSIFSGSIKLCEKLQNSLVIINNEILNDTLTFEYLQSNKKIYSHVRLFYLSLKNISYMKKLKFEKQYGFKKNCEFVKEDIHIIH